MIEIAFERAGFYVEKNAIGIIRRDRIRDENG
jgi:hypothetical protein